MWSSIGIVCLLLPLLVQLAFDVEAAEDKTRLHVSIRKEPFQAVSSCVHAFSQVELLNLDETEPIVIHSVSRTEEEMLMNANTKVKDTVAQQIHISSMSEVTLGPKQNAIIPVTFVPRFPESSSSEQPNVDSTTVEGVCRNNLAYQSNADEFQVTTNMVLDTSRGVLVIPIEASSVRRNGYRLPDVVYFRSQGGSGGQPSESPTIVDKSGDSTSTMQNDNCYQVHLSNPFQEKGLQLYNVIVSRPEMIKMYYHEEEISDSALTDMFKNWQGGDQRSIAPGVKDEYVITLCRRDVGESVPEADLKQKGGLSRSSDMNDGLGYLQIRTDANVLVVNLEETKDVGIPVKAKDVPVETESVAPTECDSGNGALDTLTSTKEQLSPPKNLSISVTEAPHIEIELVPYVSSTFVKTIELRNTSPYPIKVMRTSLKMDFFDYPDLVDAAGEVGLQLDAKVGKRNMAIVTTDSTLMDETVILTCSVASSSPRLDSGTPLRFTGTIVVSASADQDAWNEKDVNSPQKDAELSMTFPFAINIMDRQLHLMMESSPSKVPSTWKHETALSGGVKSLTGLFYPISRSQGHGGGPIAAEITYNLAVVSPVGRPLAQAKIEVVDAPGGSTARKTITNLCRRFVIPSFTTYPIPAQVGNSTLFNLGTAIVKYNFERVAEPKSKKIQGKNGMTIYDGAVIPDYCNIQVLVDSADGGRLSIPIILFSGKLDVASSEYEMPLREKEKPDEKSAVAPTVVSGFDEILVWLRSFRMGSAVKKVLKDIFDNRASDGPTMLAAYMARLYGPFSSARKSLRPILLNFGSVVHGEVQAFPLFLANHNPVPVEVSIHIGEVEGMSISLAREYSHGKGDGNGLLDRLPKEENTKSEKVTSGRWKGHSKRGLQKFLLGSSEFPQAVSSSLQYREDVSLSPAAVESQPILRTLFKEQDIGHFHAESTPRDLLASEASRCPGLDLYPPEYSDEDPRINSTSPFMISDSLSISRRLSVCREPQSTSQDSPVLIPPGGVARFEVKLRSPSRRVLDADITNVLATGLILSTNEGQVMPILASFEALLGHLQLSTLPSPGVSVTNVEGSSCGETTIDIPPRLFHSHAESNHFDGNVTAHHATMNGSVPLFITSTFAREVALNKMESCNPWFDVRLSDHGLRNETPMVNSGEKLKIGSMQSAIPCRTYRGGRDEFPSFYECASEWLQNGPKIQPRGCGLPRTAIEGNGSGESTRDEILKLATETLKKVLHFSLIQFNDGIPRRLEQSGDKEKKSPASDSDNQVAVATPSSKVSGKKVKRPTSPYVPRTVVDLFAQLSKAWGLVTESGLNVVSTHLRAQIGYSLLKDGAQANSTQQGSTSPDTTKTQTLSVAMREVAIRTALEMPTLVDHTGPREMRMRKFDGSLVSLLEFGPTRVADVGSLTVPLRNPTSVPVRVRLAAFTDSHEHRVDGIYDDIDFSFVPSDIRDRYLIRDSSVYVQNEGIRDQPNKGDAQHWWEGGGAFVLPDERGDLIQARYNLSITAGPGAHISLINPSQHAFNGLSMGCGTRCGVREDGKVDQSNQPMMKHYSPIGASAAAGTTLMGKPRPQIAPLSRYVGHIAAGGSTPADLAHPAFAIPFSALDEIVLPPFGTGELGPILFRPPGRHNSLGCDTADESKGAPFGVSTVLACAKSFESQLFLENSLTGLERIVVSGKGMWESVAFLDPVSSESSPFGDVEYRYGRSTLVFPGSAQSEPGVSAPQPVRKEVLLHNTGDVPVEFGRVYFSEAPSLRLNSPVLPRSCEMKIRKSRKVSRKAPRADDASGLCCQRRGFQLLGCAETDESEIEVNGERMVNLGNGFALLPGQNISLIVEHYPDCASSTEYVTLNFEYQKEQDNQTSWSADSSRSRHRSTRPPNEKPKARKIELLVGFDMSDDAMASCIPVIGSAGQWIGSKLAASFGTNATDAKRSSRKGKQNVFTRWLMIPAVRLGVLGLSAFAAFWVLKQEVVREGACLFFQSNLRGFLNANGSTDMPASPSAETDWSAAFRCLARADPISSELQAVGREQARQLVLERYKSVGAMTPQCISSAGVLARDRSGVVGGAVSGNEKRAMTLSDAMFRGAFTDQDVDSEIDQLLPCSLGWRAATSKGMVRKTSRPSKSRELLAHREASMSVIQENAPVEEAVEKTTRREYTSAKAQEAPQEALQVMDEGDEHKGDVISTSESEGTVGVVREVEESPLEDEDLSGFAKVGSQKGKVASRDKNRKKRAEAKASPSPADRKKTSARKDAVTLDAPQVLVYKKETNVNAKNEAISLGPKQTKHDSHDKNVSNAVAVKEKRVSTQKTKPAAVKKSAEVAKPKGKKAKNKKVAAVPPIDEKKIEVVVGSPIGMRSISSGCSSAHSSPSSLGQVSASSRSTTRSEKLDGKARKNAIRPPPGLAPPPGFGSSGSADEQLERTSSHDDSLPPMAPNLFSSPDPSPSLSLGISATSGIPVESTQSNAPKSLFSASDRPLVAASSPVLSSTQTPLAMPEPQDPQFSNSSGGFDVMDFLDNILGDQEPLVEKEEDSIGGLLSEKPSASSSMSALGVSSDPWATERKSRAATYGIHVEGDGIHAEEEEDIVYAMLAAPVSVSTNLTNGDGSSSGGLHNSVPLLTPSDMLAANQADSDDGEKDSRDGAPLFNRGSFYSSLLKE